MYFSHLHSFTQFPWIESCKKVFHSLEIMNMFSRIFQNISQCFETNYISPINSWRSFVAHIEEVMRSKRFTAGLPFCHNVFTSDSDHEDFRSEIFWWKNKWMRFAGGGECALTFYCSVARNFKYEMQIYTMSDEMFRFRSRGKGWQMFMQHLLAHPKRLPYCLTFYNVLSTISSRISNKIIKRKNFSVQTELPKVTKHKS